ncbi:MAG: thiamine-phosphate kinase [Proteobacteria bacterium]|nr:thiamine-phosphate kinase [Pseudomonadota bacterium]
MTTTPEFSLIQRYFEQLTPPRDDVKLGIGDDCALLQPPADHLLAVSIDTLVEGVHFFADVDVKTLGHKSLAVGLSDLAAMGATPAWFTLALSLPEIDEGWLHDFSQGLAALASEHNIQLVGGDTTRGPLTISIQVHGFVKQKQALRRDGAQVGDLIYVTGTLGDAGAALQLKLQQLNEPSLNENDHNYLQQRLQQPTPRLMIGQQLSGLASSAIDISDGLLADLGHILEKSHVGARLDLTQLPLSTSLQKIELEPAIQLALNSGDDYELCFTISPENAEKLGTGNYQCIGIITNNVGIIESEQTNGTVLKGKGYDHFTS